MERPLVIFGLANEFYIAKAADRLIIMFDLFTRVGPPSGRLGKVLTGDEQTQLRALPQTA